MPEVLLLVQQQTRLISMPESKNIAVQQPAPDEEFPAKQSSGPVWH